MAKVPSPPNRIDPTLGPTVFQNLQSSPDAFGAAQGRALQSAGTAAQQFGGQLVEQERLKQIADNKRAVKQASVDHKKRLIEIKNEFDQLKGEAAVDAEEDFRLRIVELREEISSSITNSVVLDDFLLESALDETNSLDNLNRSANREAEFAEQVATATVIEEENNLITANFFDDDQVALSIARIGVEARAEAIRVGLSEDDIELAGQRAESNAVKISVIAALAARQTSRAQQIFNGEFGRSLQGQDLIDVERMVSSAADLEFAQEQADVVASLARRPDGTIDLRIANGLLNETLKGQQLEDAKIELNKLIVESEAVKEQRLETAETSLDAHLSQGGTLSEWTSQNPEAYEELQGDSNRMKRIQAHRKAQAAGLVFAGVSDNSTWPRIMRLNGKKLAQLNLDLYKAQLTESEYNSLVRAQSVAINAVEGGDTQTPSQVRSVISNARGVMDRYTNTIPGISTQRQDDPEAAANLKVLLERKMDEFVKPFTDVGKEPSTDELNKEASRLIMQIQAGDPGINFFGVQFTSPDFEGIAAQKNRLTPEQRTSSIVPIEVMTELQKFEWTERFNDVGISPSDNMLEQLGGAIAMQDVDRIFNLLTIRVKE